MVLLLLLQIELWKYAGYIIDIELKTFFHHTFIHTRQKAQNPNNIFNRHLNLHIHRIFTRDGELRDSTLKLPVVTTPDQIISQANVSITI
jgi:hypothetical protein